MGEEFAWYQDRKDGLGYEFLAEVRVVFRQIEEHPLGHAQVYRDVRRALVRRFPYKVFDLFEADKIEVIGVIYARRNAQFWRRRVP
jgi:toxin ParE1/3/4